MSRAYRITMKESETRNIRGTDEISTRLELLEILPPEQMAELLRGELQQRGFTEAGDGTLTRRDGALTVTVDPCNGEVSVKAEVAETVTIEVKRETSGWDDAGPSPSAIRERVKEQLQGDIDKKAGKEVERLQERATEVLEKHLDELQPELGQIINKVTRDALKQKAAQLGTIKELTEDAETGSLTIKVEV